MSACGREQSERSSGEQSSDDAVNKKRKRKADFAKEKQEKKETRALQKANEKANKRKATEVAKGKMNTEPSVPSAKFGNVRVTRGATDPNNSIKYNNGVYISSRVGDTIYDDKGLTGDNGNNGTVYARSKVGGLARKASARIALGKLNRKDPQNANKGVKLKIKTVK